MHLVGKHFVAQDCSSTHVRIGNTTVFSIELKMVSSYLTSQTISLILVIYIQNSVQLETFYPFEVATSCDPTKEKNLPHCIFSSSTSPNNFNFECLQPGLLRIRGEYSIIKIFCTSSYAIDLYYFGHQPTEAINVTWTKSVQANTNGKGITFEMEILIYSVQYLFNYYNRTNGNTKLQGYTRSGKYVIRGIWNASLEKTYNIFFEDDLSKPSFLRNSMTNKPLNKSDHFLLPCLSSHYHANITAFEVNGNREIPLNANYSIFQGFSIRSLSDLQENTKYVRCKLQHNNHADEMNLDVIQKQNNVVYGLEDLKVAVKGDVEINYRYRLDNKSVVHVAPWCRVQSLTEPNTMISAMPAHNFAYLRLVREFVLPQFVNQSYNVRIGTEKEQLPREIRISEKNGLHDRFGVTFCRSGDEHRLIEYGTSHTNGEVIKINYGLDWTLFNREISEIKIFFLLQLENISRGAVMYLNTVMTFACRVHEAVVVKPTIWYTLRKNGSYVEELIDYNWRGVYSYFSKNMTSDIVRVCCAGSFWYGTTWRNVSMNLNLVEGHPPVIKSKTLNYIFRPKLQHQILNCEAGGNPRPKLSWHLNKFDISSNAVTTGTSIILDFPKVTHSHAGVYICKAENSFGTVEKSFTVVVEDEPGVNYAVVIGIPALIVTILFVMVYFYIRRWKKQQIGLTKAEIAEFLQGEISSRRASSLNEYAHDFAHLTPYSGEFEIHSSQYQIDESTILGAGAFGTVYKGLVNGLPVAVKTVNKYAEKSYLKALLSELKIMIYIEKHPNLVELLGANTSQLSQGNVYIFIKYYPRSSLEKYLKANRQNYSHDVKLEGCYTNSFGYESLLNWSMEIANAMEYLGQKKVIHGDLAARNVLLSEDLHAVITDFGLSKQLYDYADYVKRNHEPLPWRWMSIESLRDMKFSTHSDVWSFGITIWEIFSLGEIPYPGYTWNMSFIGELEKGLRMTRPKYGSLSLYKEIVSLCWHIDPAARPTFQEICLQLKRQTVPLKSPAIQDNTNSYANTNV